MHNFTGPCNVVGSESDCRSRGREFDPCLVPYFHGDLSKNNFMVILLPSAFSRRVVVSYKRKYVHKVLVNCLFKLAQEEVVIGELTILTWQKLLTWT